MQVSDSLATLPGAPAPMAAAKAAAGHGLRTSARWVGVGLFIAVLCLVDAAATHWEISAQLTHEANPLMAPLLACGWGWVWAVKLLTAGAVPAVASVLHRHLWGRWLLLGTSGSYLFTCGCHALILMVDWGIL